MYLRSFSNTSLGYALCISVAVMKQMITYQAENLNLKDMKRNFRSHEEKQSFPLRETIVPMKGN
ncbi:hypothetical protein DW182_04840 [Bacteroides sp. AM16-24]|nr:hypothetical protein DW182_04840 [Bacteroides sp. AM16-24]